MIFVFVSFASTWPISMNFYSPSFLCFFSCYAWHFLSLDFKWSLQSANVPLSLRESGKQYLLQPQNSLSPPRWLLWYFCAVLFLTNSKSTICDLNGQSLDLQIYLPISMLILDPSPFFSYFPFY